MNALAALLPAALALAACATAPKPERLPAPAPANVQPVPPVSPSQPLPAMPPTLTDSPPDRRLVMPGMPVPGSRIAVARSVRAGESLHGQVPVGSEVDINGQRVAVDAAGRFSYPVAASASGTLLVRVKHRQDRPPMPLRVQILAPGN